MDEPEWNLQVVIKLLEKQLANKIIPKRKLHQSMRAYRDEYNIHVGKYCELERLLNILKTL